MVATARLFQASVHDVNAIGDLVGYYCGTYVEGYYTASSETLGYWLGSGTDHFSLHGEVKREDLFHLLRGKHPKSKHQLVRLQKQTDGKKRQRGQDRSGLDITFSAPKSVSLLWALSSPEQRAIIEDCFRGAIEETVKQIEQQCPLVRSGKGGTEWSLGNLVCAVFIHKTARNYLEPALHGHLVTPNIVVTQDGKIQKINTKALLPFVRLAGPLLRNNFYTRMYHQLGVTAHIPLKGNKQCDWFELDGFSKSLLRAFSSRRREIEDQTAAFGHSNASSAATQYANFLTRKPKGKHVPTEELEYQWQQKAAAHGFTPQMIQGMIGHVVKDVTQEEINATIKKAIDQITLHEAVFDRLAVVRKASELLQDRPITGTNIFRGVDLYLQQSQDIVVVRKVDGQQLYTTATMARMENETIQCVERMAARPGLAVASKFIERAIKESPVKLSPEQEQCVRAVLTCEQSIASVTGHAGAGKTTVLKVLKRAYELAGKTVIGTAISGVATEKIQQTMGGEARTLASLLHEFKKKPAQAISNGLTHHAKMLGRAARKKKTWKKEKAEPLKVDENMVFFPDESGMIDLLTMHPFLKELDRCKASVLFVGDPKAQLTPVGPGNPTELIDAQTLVGELKHNWRQTEVEAKAALHVREGNSAEALKVYEEKGDLIVTKDRDALVKRTVEDWAEQAAKTPKHAIILAQTNAEIATLNQLCQQERIKSGAIGGSSLNVNGVSFHKGERVIFRNTDNLLGIKNGHRGEVIRIGDDGSLLIKIDGKEHVPTLKERLKAGLLNRPEDKSLVKLSAEQAAKLDIRLGYASTTHSYQGSQADHVFVVLGGRFQDRRISYVQLSRSTARARLYVDRPHAGPELSSIIKAMDKQTVKQNVSEISPKLELKLTRNQPS